MAKSNFDFTSSSWPRMPEAPTRDSNLPGPGEEYTDNFYESLTMSVTSLQPPSSGSYSSSQYSALGHDADRSTNTVDSFDQTLWGPAQFSLPHQNYSDDGIGPCLSGNTVNSDMTKTPSLLPDRDTTCSRFPEMQKPQSPSPSTARPLRRISSYSSGGSSLSKLVITCDQCNKEYTGKYRMRNLKRHIQSKHNGLLWPCEQEGCGEICQRKDALLNHCRRHHPYLAQRPHKPRKQKKDGQVTV